MPSDALYLDEDEIARRVGVGRKEWFAIVTTLEKAGFPPQDPLFSGRRYWPAVRAFLDRRYGLGAVSPSSLKPDGEENWDDRRSTRRAGAQA